MAAAGCGQRMDTGYPGMARHHPLHPFNRLLPALVGHSGPRSRRFAGCLKLLVLVEDMLFGTSTTVRNHSPLQNGMPATSLQHLTRARTRTSCSLLKRVAMDLSPSTFNLHIYTEGLGSNAESMVSPPTVTIALT